MATRRAGDGRRTNADADGFADPLDVYGVVRGAILSGKHPPGARLVETRIAAELGVSRTRVRETLARLEAENLVARAPNRGVLVRQLTSSDIEDIYDLRLLLESYGARKAAANITTPELEDLRDIQAEMAKLESNAVNGIGDRLEIVRQITELNNEFHQSIQRISRNSRLHSVLRTVTDVPLIFRSFYWYTDNELVEAAREHHLIIEALTARDADRSGELMREHIARGLNTLRREIASGRS